MRKFTTLAKKFVSLSMHNFTSRAMKLVTKEEGAKRVEYGFDGRADRRVLDCRRAVVGH